MAPNRTQSPHPDLPRDVVTQVLGEFGYVLSGSHAGPTGGRYAYVVPSEEKKKKDREGQDPTRTRTPATYKRPPVLPENGGKIVPRGFVAQMCRNLGIDVDRFYEKALRIQGT